MSTPDYSGWPAQSGPYGPAPAPPRRSWTAIVIAVGIAIVVLVLGVATAFLLISRGGGDNSDPDKTARTFIEAINRNDGDATKSLICSADRDQFERLMRVQQASDKAPGSAKSSSTLKSVDADGGTFVVDTTTAGKTITVSYDLKKEGGSWKVCNVLNPRVVEKPGARGPAGSITPTSIGGGIPTPPTGGTKPNTAADPAEAKKVAAEIAKLEQRESTSKGKSTKADDFAPYACSAFLSTIREDYQKWQTNPPAWDITAIDVTEPVITGNSATVPFTTRYSNGDKARGVYKEQIEKGHWCVSDEVYDN